MMMRPLLAYLIVRRPPPEGSHEVATLDVSSYRDLDGLRAAWEQVVGEGASAVAHVGFWRPDTESFTEILAAHPGTVLLTESARGALPPSFCSASRPCASAGGLRLYEALSGWGYERLETAAPGDTAAAQGDKKASKEESYSPRCRWLALAMTREPELGRKAAEAGISDDTEYFEKESFLNFADRDALARFRFRCMSGGEPSEQTILGNLGCAPPWLLALNVKALGLSTRPTHRLAEKAIVSVADVARFGESQLMKIPMMGRKSVAEIATGILDAFSRGSAFCSAHARVSNATSQASLREIDRGSQISQRAASVSGDDAPPSFASALDEVLEMLEEREKRVLSLRMGVDGAARTLEAIGEIMGVTRERVRQIEAKALGRVAVMVPQWTTWLGSRLDRMLDGREDPLPLVGLDALDPWFRSAADMETSLKYALSHFQGEQRHWLLRIEGQVYVTGIDEETWSAAGRKAKGLLASHVKDGPALAEGPARWLVESLLIGRGEELRPLLWKSVTQWANFSVLTGGERLLVSVGQGAENVVEAVLMESARPLHYEEISRLCAERGRPVEVRRAHNAAAKVGFLLARGVYGLDKHVPLNDEERATVLSEAENLLVENATKHWHAVEICDGLEERGLDFGGRLTNHVVNYVLRSSRHLVYLGRMVWAAKSTGVRGIPHRIDVWQAMASMLEANEGPMRTEEIRGRLSRDRGLGETFQLHERDPVVRVDEGTWGLLWRDIPFSEEEAADIVAEMEGVMRARGEGLHVTEIVGSLSRTAGVASRARSPVLLVSLARRSGRMKSGAGGYVYPSDWEGPNRMCANEAVARALAETGAAGARITDIAKRAAVLLGRDIPNVVAGSMVVAAGGVYDAATGRWLKPETDEPDPVDVEGE